MGSELVAIGSEITKMNVPTNLLLFFKVEGAPCLEDFSVDMQNPMTPGTLVEIVNVLSDDACRVMSAKPGESKVSSVRLDLSNLLPSEVIEIENALRMLSKRTRGANFLDAIAFP